MQGKPKQIPAKWGSEGLMPKLTPDVISIMLFGPGVMPDEKANSVIANINSMMSLP
jgi:hypothetical protein